jgi:predicted RNase H-like nuclease
MSAMCCPFVCAYWMITKPFGLENLGDNSDAFIVAVCVVACANQSSAAARHWWFLALL